jgi:hypothetical protein
VNKIHTEIPYSKRCEFCDSRSQPGVAVLHADNQAIPTFSVRACAECFGKLIHGDCIPDMFGWSWSISLDGVVTAETDWTLTLSWDYREECAETLGVTPPTSTQEARELVRDLVRALSQHLDPRLNPLSGDIRGRDEVLLFRAMNYLGEFTEKGVPDGDH